MERGRKREKGRKLFDLSTPRIIIFKRNFRALPYVWVVGLRTEEIPITDPAIETCFIY